MASFRALLKQYPKSPYAPEAQIRSRVLSRGRISSTRRTMLTRRFKSTYPSKNVVEIKLARIRERKAQRSH